MQLLLSSSHEPVSPELQTFRVQTAALPPSSQSRHTMTSLTWVSASFPDLLTTKPDAEERPVCLLTYKLSLPVTAGRAPRFAFQPSLSQTVPSDKHSSGNPEPTTQTMARVLPAPECTSSNHTGPSGTSERAATVISLCSPPLAMCPHPASHPSCLLLSPVQGPSRPAQTLKGD